VSSVSTRWAWPSVRRIVGVTAVGIVSVLVVEVAGGSLHLLAHAAFLSRDVLPMLVVHIVAGACLLPQIKAVREVRTWGAVGWTAFGLALSFLVAPLAALGGALFLQPPLVEACASGQVDREMCREHMTGVIWISQLILFPALCIGLVTLVVALLLMLRRPATIANFLAASAAARRP
jgi:hypothetical protein